MSDFWHTVNAARTEHRTARASASAVDAGKQQDGHV
jgi:hypothetical protein